LQVHLNEIGPDGKLVVRALEPAWLEELLQGGEPFPYHATRRVEAPVWLHRMGLEVLVEADFRVPVESACSACLKEFQLELPVAFRVSLQPAAARPRELPAQLELTGADVDADFYEEEFIQVDEILREQILLALPMVPRCADTCRGLCPVCGVDLNQESCGCSLGEEDPRWSSLASMKASSSKGDERP
jgi:uncharacterized protein